MKRFCIDCQTSACTNCVEIDGPHYGHNHRLESAIVSEEKKKIRDHTARCFENCCDLQELTTALRDVDIGLEANKNTCLAAFRADTDAILAAFTARRDAIEQAVDSEVQARRRTVRVQREAAEGGLWRTDACRREALAAVAATGMFLVCSFFFASSLFAAYSLVACPRIIAIACSGHVLYLIYKVLMLLICVYVYGCEYVYKRVFLRVCLVVGSFYCEYRSISTYNKSNEKNIHD